MIRRPGPQPPPGLERLDELAHNLWWSWNSEARDLFRMLDHQLWSQSGHNPVKQLRDIGPDKLRTAARDQCFVDRYESVMSAFDAYMGASDKWFHANYPRHLDGPVAYFSMEFAIHNSLPIYAGGLGVLAGDYCREASDLGIPMVAVGFLYLQGYFHQKMTPDGWQQEEYRHLEFSETPIEPVLSPDGRRLLVQVWLKDRPLFLAAWRVCVGRTAVYLLNTDLEENSPEDRPLSSRLYTADRDQRIQQEIALGLGGVRMLRALSTRFNPGGFDGRGNPEDHRSAQRSIYSAGWCSACSQDAGHVRARGATDLEKEDVLTTEDTYRLCRCGQSSTKPFCDGTHTLVEFDGYETADTGSTADRAVHYEGDKIVVQNDRSLCTHAGFCGNRITNIWKMIKDATDTQVRAQIMAMVERCPSGALSFALEPDGEIVEPDLPIEIAVIPDGPLWVSGGVPVERRDGQPLETRNRTTLCRCGASKIKPLCDGTRKEVGFSDASPVSAAAAQPRESTQATHPA